MPPSILFVDDEPHVLHALARRLRGQPYTIYTARSGQESLQVVKAHRVDVIVADEHMPGMSGSELLSWMARNFPDVPRIVLTGRPDIHSAIRAINDGRVFRYLTKPCKIEDLASAIRLALEHGAATPSSQSGSCSPVADASP